MTQYWKSSERLSFHVMKIWWGASCGMVHRGEKTIRRGGPAFTAVPPGFVLRNAPKGTQKLLKVDVLLENLLRKYVSVHRIAAVTRIGLYNKHKGRM